MKIRNGFVSNSSSSSFVLAVRSDATEEQIKEVFYNDKENVLQFLKDSLDYLEINEECDGDVDLAFELFVGNSAQEIMADSRSGLDLGGWKVYGGTCGDDYGGDLGAYLYRFGDIKSEILKINFGD